MKAFFKWLVSLFIRQPVELPIPVGEVGELPGVGEHRKVKLAIVVGHTRDNQGARMLNGQTEYQYNSEVARLIERYAREKGSIDVVLCFRDGVGIAGAYRKAIDEKADAAIELHFNSFNRTATGTETLCTADLTDVEFAHIVHKAVCEVFSRGGTSRGVKALSRSARGGENVHSFPNRVNCLVEPAFGDHPDDAQMLVSRQDQYALAIVEAVDLWARKKDLI